MTDKESPDRCAAIIENFRKEMAKRIVGQNEMIDGLLAGLIAGGHVLLEGVPGLAKTLAVKSFAQIIGLDFKRIQFTPDLLPADLTGTLIWEQATGNFSVRRGPIFANIILADEINRAPAKVQSALLEAMEEKQVTIGEKSYPLPNPFFVLATENPIEHEGTYSLPEAELDRFLMKLLIAYPKPDEELEIIKNSSSFSAAAAQQAAAQQAAAQQAAAQQAAAQQAAAQQAAAQQAAAQQAAAQTTAKKSGSQTDELSQVLDAEAIKLLRNTADSIHIDEQINKYIVSIVTATRPVSKSTDGVYRYMSFGASPRASIALYRCCRIFAMLGGRNFVTPEDVKNTALPVLRHRIVLSYEAEAEGMDADAVIARILSHVPVP